MMTYRIFSFILALALLAPISVSAHGKKLAQDSSGTGSTTTKRESVREMVKAKQEASKTALEEFRAATEAQKLTKLKAYGLRLIEHRLDALEKQDDRIDNGKCKEVSDEIQAAITEGLSDVEDNLNTQKASLEAATTLADARTIVQNIIKENRVFTFLIPASNGACISQRLIALIDGKLTDAVTKLKDAGIDTTSIEAKMAAAKTSAQSAYETYLEILQSPGTDTNKTSMGEAKTLLQSVRKALGDIKSDIGNVMGEYKQKTGTSDSDSDDSSGDSDSN